MADRSLMARFGAGMRPFGRATGRRLALAGMAAALAACVGGSADRMPPPTGKFASLPLPQMRTFGPLKPLPARRSNAEMARDFIDLSFRLESGRPMEGFSRFEGPVTVAMAGAAPPTAARDLERLLSRLRSEAGLDIRRTDDAGAASITVNFIAGQKMRSVAPEASCFAVPRVSGWGEYRSAGLATLDWTTYLVRQRAAIFVPSDTAPQEVRDCLNEELGQALGPLNDLFRVPDTIFNDDNVYGMLTGFDMLMLRATYAPELRPGMGPDAVAARLPGILSRINPGGNFAGHPAPSTPRAYGDAIAAALGPGSGGSARRLGAAMAAYNISAPWQDHRTGFALMAMGRLRGPGEREAAKGDFERALAIFEARGEPLRAALARQQLTLVALDEGNWPEAARLARAGRPAAEAGGDAALLSLLMLAEAAALDRMGQADASARLRLDSLGWARYGMGSDALVRRRAQMIALISGTGG